MRRGLQLRPARPSGGSCRRVRRRLRQLGGSATPPATTTDAAAGGATALSGSVGPGFDISMNETTAAAGTYTLKVDDQATSHNFHLTGPGGVDVMTDIGGTGTKTFTVKLEPGTYTFVCDAHPTSMKGTLKVS